MQLRWEAKRLRHIFVLCKFAGKNAKITPPKNDDNFRFSKTSYFRTSTMLTAISLFAKLNLTHFLKKTSDGIFSTFGKNYEFSGFCLVSCHLCMGNLSEIAKMEKWGKNSKKNHQFVYSKNESKCGTSTLQTVIEEPRVKTAPFSSGEGEAFFSLHTFFLACS
jgi:hypothetical protein